MLVYKHFSAFKVQRSRIADSGESAAKNGFFLRQRWLYSPRKWCAPFSLCYFSVSKVLILGKMMMPYTKHYIKMASHAIYIDSDGVRTRRTDERSAARQVKMQVNSATDFYFFGEIGRGERVSTL